MNNYVTGNTIRELREKKKITQKKLSEILCVSDKTVSKWETGRGLPDISLLEPLAAALGVSLAELLSGQCISNANRSANMINGKFYVCPVCGNAVFATGEGSFSCCGVQLPALEVEDDTENESCDLTEKHQIVVERVENEWYVTVEHPMTKDHYISFIAFVTANGVNFAKQYPEQNAQTRYLIGGRGKIYAYCNHHGLFCVKV